MPPLMEEETIPFESTNYGGKACENIVKSYFLTNQINIADPHVDDGVDLLIQKPNGWVRGQVKKVVYQQKLDYGHKKQFGKEIYRPRFQFPFQRSGSLEIKQRTIDEIDYFYHVLLTPYRTLIWETPSSLIPLRKDGSFIQNKNPSLDSNGWIRKRAEIDFNKLLVYCQYDPIIFKKYPEFFLTPEPVSLDNFF